MPLCFFAVPPEPNVASGFLAQDFWKHTLPIIDNETGWLGLRLNGCVPSLHDVSCSLAPSAMDHPLALGRHIDIGCG